MFRSVPAWKEPLRQDCDGSHPARVDRLLIRTAAGQAGIGDHDGHIGRSAPHLTARASAIWGHTVATDTNPDRSTRPAPTDSQRDIRAMAGDRVVVSRLRWHSDPEGWSRAFTGVVQERLGHSAMGSRSEPHLTRDRVSVPSSKVSMSCTGVLDSGSVATLAAVGGCQPTKISAVQPTPAS